MGAKSKTYAALLRGVNNIGTSKRISMAELRAAFEDLGFQNVRTLLNSGNVIFSAPAGPRAKLLARIEHALAAELQFTSPVFLLSAAEIAEVVNDNPFSRIATNPSNLLVAVPRKASDLRRLQPLLKQRWSPESLGIGRRVAYIWCANGVPRSPLWSAVDRALERTGTVRNFATFTKVKALIEQRHEE